MQRTVENFKISLFQKNLSEYFIDKYKDELDWSFILQNKQLSESFIKGHINYIDWEQIVKQKNLSEEFIMDFVLYKIGICRTISNFKLSEKNLKIFLDKEKLSLLLKNKVISDGYVCDSSIMYHILKNQNLSEHFIETYYDKYYLNYILKFQKVSEHFLERHWNDIIHNEDGTENNDAKSIMMDHQELSESFIMNHYNELGWDNILETQQLSESFIQKLIDKKYIVLSK